MTLLDENKTLEPLQWLPAVPPGSRCCTRERGMARHCRSPTRSSSGARYVHCETPRGAPRLDVAAEHDQSYELCRLLKPKPSPLAPDRIKALDVHLAEVIDGRVGRLSSGRTARPALRYPPVEILHELPQWSLWFPVPRMYGGFHIELRLSYLEVLSWNLEPGGSMHMHAITHEGAVLVAEGLV
jgi:hypothetical protein